MNVECPSYAAVKSVRWRLKISKQSMVLHMCRFFERSTNESSLKFTLESSPTMVFVLERSTLKRRSCMIKLMGASGGTLTFA